MIDPVMLSALSRGLQGAAATSSTTQTADAASAAQAGHASFADVMKDTATSMVGDLKNAEHVSFESIAGKASTRQLVDAVMTADRSLQTAVAIRDKLVSAYLDITKMPI